MALAGQPKLILMDEPTAGMGSTETQHLVALLARLRESCAILLVEHDMDVVFSLADRITVLDNGRSIHLARHTRSGATRGCAAPILEESTKNCHPDMLELIDVETFYGRKQVLFGVHLKLSEGGAVALIGRNGMGKTTTVRSIMGSLRRVEDGLFSMAAKITRLPSYQIARAGIGVVPEGRQIFPTLTVYENLIATAANRHGGRPPWTIGRIYELFPRSGQRHANMGWQLSGGEQQMLAIGRALMTNPKSSVLDEATEGIAPIIRNEIWLCLKSLRAQGHSLLVIDKDIEALAQVADHCHILVKGRIAWSGAFGSLASDPSVWQRYLGV